MVCATSILRWPQPRVDRTPVSPDSLSLLLGSSEILTETATTAFTPLLISHSQLEQANMRLLGVQKEALLLVLHLLFQQVERKDVSWSTPPSPIAVCS